MPVTARYIKSVMSIQARKFKHTVATVFAVVTFSLPLHGAAWADLALQESLLDQLRGATPEDSKRIARQLTREWAKSGSAAMDLLLKRGNDALKGKDMAAAIEHFSAAIDHAPDFAEAYVGRAVAYYHSNKYGPAVADLEQALALNPNHYGAIRGLGAVFESIGRPKRAYEAYQQVLDIHPHDPEVLEAVKRLENTALGQKL